mmetsp:Transcript_35537/g.102132  ORF Transcript_35537/g.102132 Transcript_35537/m.102132 type:complete len:81 (+) Transcript_35537:2160-2402(+)
MDGWMDKWRVMRATVVVTCIRVYCTAHTAYYICCPVQPTQLLTACNAWQANTPHHTLKKARQIPTYATHGRQTDRQTRGD